MAGKGDGVEVWRGVVAARDGDAAGCADASVVLARAMEGLAGLAAELGLADAFAPRAASTLLVREHHLRRLGPVEAGAPLAMTAGVLSLDETEALALQVLRCGRTGEPRIAVLTRFAHVDAREARPFAWSARTREAAQALTVEAPAYARPHGLDEASASALAAGQAGAADLATTGRGVVGPQECDVFGRLRPDAVMARCLAAATHLPRSGPDPAPDAGPIEARLIYLRPAAAGARLELRSGRTGTDEVGERCVHWLLDPADGETLALVLTLASVAGSGARRPPARGARLAKAVSV